MAEASGTKPAGFEASVISDPHRDEDGVIRGTSPLSVEFDACRSRPGDGSPLYFYFDWDFDHVANVWGTGDACLQTHTFRANAEDEAAGSVTFHSNVCVANGDLQRHDPATYVSCREFTISVPRVPRVEPCEGPQPDRFTNLTAPHGLQSDVLGNMTANDCPPQTLVNGRTSTPFVNVELLILGSNGNLRVICTAEGPFSGTFLYLVYPSGQAEVFISGECT